jgi:HD-GYP domain-containing protein (c-di-GMP phosphodiesterase class II)
LAISQVAGGGAFYDAPAASVLHGNEDAQAMGSMMSAARALASALELKDTYTGGHAERVTHMAIRLARAALLEDAMPSEALEAGFLLHDVGKIGIPESILNKPAGLTDTERRVLNTHPILGERIIAPLGFPVCVGQVVRHHHERWDGTGYPDRLRGEDIPGAARLFSIADSIDAMTSIRPYRLPVTFEEAVNEIKSHAGTQFDPDLAMLASEVFLDSAIRLPAS